MGISFGSINSGLPKDIVQQIVEADKIPVKQMEARKEKIEEKKALVTQLTSLVEALRGEVLKNKGARSLREVKINTGENSNISVVADKNIANPGKHNLEIIQLAQSASAITNGVEDKDKTYLGVGYIRAILPNGDEKEIYVDKENATLTGIAKLINADSDLGLKANVINDGSGEDEPWKLILSIDGTGDANNAEFPNLYLVDGEVDLYVDEVKEAQDAKIKLNGFEVEVPANRVSDLIPGLTIDLKKAKPGEEISLEVTEDVQKIGGKIASVIESMNNLLKFIKQQNSLDEKSDTSRTLGGDLTLTTIEGKIRTALFTPIKTSKGTYRIGDFGINFERSGLIKFDQEKFEAALAKDYKVVSESLTGSYTIEGGKVNGFIDTLEDTSKTLLNTPNGALYNRKQGLQSQINQIDRQITNRQRALTQKEEILKQKFARLEETMARIRGQGAGLAGMAQSSNPIQQLG